MTLGDRLRESRLEKGMTLKEVAEQLGIAEASYQRYESGIIKNPKQANLRELARILDVDYNYLMGFGLDAVQVDDEVVEDYCQEDLDDLIAIFKKIGRKQRHELMVKAYHLERITGRSDCE